MNEATKSILDLFAQISQIPRCSKKETQISTWVKGWANRAGHAVSSDASGNVLVSVAGRGHGLASASVGLQAHLDMVCEKIPASAHDFDRDPIQLITEGEWMRANDTTMGADNGIGMAFSLYAASGNIKDCPPLELLFTVDEETGLNGASRLKPGFLTAERLINIDSEQEGVFTVGCAGGRDTNLNKRYPSFRPMTDPGLFEVTVSGLRGGHSGVDIHLQRANANQLLTRTLTELYRHQPFQLHQIEGGSAHNAIARDAVAVVASDPMVGERWNEQVRNLEEVFRAEWGKIEPTLNITVQPAPMPENLFLLSGDATREILRLITALPHGVIRRSTAEEVLVETSCNLAIVKLSQGNLDLVSSQRSLVSSRLQEMTTKVHALADLINATATDSGGYPPWTPRPRSPLLALARDTYQTLFRKSAQVRTIHAGLECGIIGNLYPGMDMISLGPTIRDAHSPREAMYLPSIGRVWQLLAHLLTELC